MHILIAQASCVKFGLQADGVLRAILSLPRKDGLGTVFTTTLPAALPVFSGPKRPEKGNNQNQGALTAVVIKN
jgi:hypothetical protein